MSAIYYNGQTSQAQSVEVSINESLRFADQNWLLPEIQLIERWNGQRAILGYGAQRLHIMSEVDWRAIYPRLKPQRQAHKTNWQGLSIWVLAGLLGIWLIYISLPKIAYWAAPHIPDKWLTSLGDNLLLGFTENRQVCTDKNGHYALNKMMQPLVKSSGLNPESIKIVVVKAKQPNALSLPGNRFIIFSGLIRQATSSEEVAGVMAHELAHATHRHSAQAMTRIGSYILLSEVIFPGSSLLTAGIILSELRYSRGFEYQADVTAIQTLRENSISTRGLERFFDRLEVDGNDERSTKESRWKLPTYLSTHPESAKRAQLFRSPITKYQVKPVMNNKEWKMLKGICR